MLCVSGGGNGSSDSSIMSGGGSPAAESGVLACAIEEGSGALCRRRACTISAVRFTLWIAILRRSKSRTGSSVTPHWLRMEWHS